jgi:phosphomannomutase
MEFPEWRFNLRMSNTEPVIRLNIESRGDHQILQKNQDALLALIESV